ncbi:GGDEF domain-containing protein [Phycicoccus sp.]|uniref:GGDEF domain-containing protein n=1 Tax=Phycicoccus sp. TaxID=1902410 RepID=UPI002B68B22C|nr:GGDEF domain-containing protein [Phycicoccus sp.]HMM94748.1 GGDEF domain-containing protein [Phycicoccus sp.]
MTAAMTPAPAGSRARSEAHQSLLDEVRALVLPAQTPGALDTELLADLVRRAEREGWADVVMAAQYVRALASVGDPHDSTRARLDDLLDRAAAEGDHVWEALCLAMGATDVVEDARPRLVADRDLARATVLLRDAPPGHEMLASAHVECATGYLDRDMWDLALEHTSAAAAYLENHERDAWRMATAMYNRAEIQLRRLCVLRQAGPRPEVDEVGARARAAIQRVPVELLPADWALDLHIFENLVDAIAPPAGVAPRPLARGDDAEFAAYLDLAASFTDPDPRAARRHVARTLEAWTRIRQPELYLLALTRDAELEAAQVGEETAGLRLSRELALRRQEARVAAAEAMGSLIENEQMLAEHARLRVAAEVDVLTGVANRRGLAAHVETLLEGAHSSGRDEVTLVLVDVDHFKGVNDTHGHDVGDEVLVRVAASLRTIVRGTDLVVRWGGDEFLLLLDTDHLEVAARRCREVAEMVRHDFWDDLADGLRVTVSIGLAVGKVADLDGLRDAADRALYRAKERGRDGVAT